MPSDKSEASLLPEPPLQTEYEIPLSDNEIMHLGRFAAVFSQVDYLLNEAISALTKSPWWAANIMLDNVTTGPKLQMLRKIIKKTEADPAVDSEARTLATKAADALASLLDKRNHVVHGMWSQQLVTPQRAVKPACFLHRFADGPVFASELKNLATKGAEVTRLLGDLLTHLSPEDQQRPWTEPRKMFVTDRPVAELGWFLGERGLKKMSYPNPGDTLKST